MPNIPPKANRRGKNCFSPVLYRSRNAIERSLSMQSKDTFDGAKLGGLDELGMCDGDCEQLTFKRFFPEREEIM